MSGWTAITSSNNAQRYLKRSSGPRSQEILPGIWSFDARYLAMMETLYSRLTSEFQAHNNADGTAGDNGVPGDWSSLLSVSGYGMDPLPIPFIDNGGLRESYGLIANGTFASEDDRALFHELLDEMFGYHAPASLAIRKPANTSAPYFTDDIEYKLSAIRKALNNLKEYLELQVKRPREALDAYDSAMAYAIYERQQADSSEVTGKRVKPKQRVSPDEKYVRSLGDEGRIFDCDKSVVIEGRLYEMHAAMRRRPVFGMSFVPNHVVAAVFAQMRTVYLDRFAYTWKHRSSDEKAQKLEGAAAIMGCDVKNMDNTLPRFAIEEMCTGLRRHLRDDFVDLLQAMYFAPFMMSNPYRDKRQFGSFFGGDPFVPASWTSFPGLASGISSNPDTGKFWMVFVYIAAARAIGADIPKGKVAAFLRGELAVKLLDMSDDAVFAFPSAELAERFAKYESPYMKLGPEIPAQFLGDVAVRREGKIAFVPNIVTYVSNFYVPERGINNASRKAHWSTGFVERQHHYSRAPLYKEVDAVVEHTVQEYFGIKPSTLAAVEAMRVGQLAPQGSIDEQVLANPHYLHYRIEAKEVSPAVLATIAAVVPAEEVAPLVAPLFRSSTT